MSQGRETRPISEVRAEKQFQAKFQQDVRQVGIHKAVDNMEAMNARKRASAKRDENNRLEGLASNATLGGLKFGWGGTSRNAPNRTKTIYHGDGTKTERVWKDGKLVSETNTPL